VRIVKSFVALGLILGATFVLGRSVTAQTQPAPGGTAARAETDAASNVTGYTIGTDDVLAIVFWREKDLSRDVVVRPDGRISLPLLNDVMAAGLTPDELRHALDKVASKYVEDPRVTVVVKEINSRKVFITGQVAKQGPYSLTSPITVMQLITMAGGVLEFADDKNISIMRVENGETVSYRFNYSDVKRRRNLQQNILLKPGDTVIVP
jgi:polysaccharide biosynthesis/export protein